MRKIITLAAVLTLTACGGGSSEQGAVNMNSEDLMTAIKKQNKVMGKMAKGEVEYQAEAFTAAAKAMNDLAQQMPTTFKETGLQAVIDNRADFDEKVAKFQSDSKLLSELPADATKDQAMAQFKQVASNCKACHKPYKPK